MRFYLKVLGKSHDCIRYIFEFFSQLLQIFAVMFMIFMALLNEMNLLLGRPLQTYAVIERSIPPTPTEKLSKSGARMELGTTLEVQVQGFIQTCS
jgi:hypothetical protein